MKKFVEERELTLMLLVDVSGSGLFGSGAQSKRELAAEIASVLAITYEAEAEEKTSETIVQKIFNELPVP